MVCCSIKGPPIERLTWADWAAIARARVGAGVTNCGVAAAEVELRASIVALPGFDDDPLAADRRGLNAVRRALSGRQP